MIFSEMTTMRKLMLLHGIVGGKAVEDYASGNPCVFTTDLAKPLRRLALTLLPKQEGTGDPSPENIRPLIPWGEVGTWHGGKNLFDIGNATLKKWLLNNNAFQTVADDNPRVTFAISGDRLTIATQAKYLGVCFEIESCPFARVVSVPASFGAVQLWSDYADGATRISTGQSSCVIPANTSGFIGLRVDNIGTVETTVQIEAGQTATPYTPYSSITPHPVNLQRNLLPYPYNNTTTTKEGITFTDNGDGTITADGTASANAVFYLKTDVVLKAGNYIVPKVGENDSSATYSMRAYFSGGGSTIGYTTRGDVLITLEEDSALSFSLYVYKNATVNNVLLKPSVQVGTEAEPYQPYIPPVYGCSVDLTTGEVWGTWADKAVSETRPSKTADHIFSFYLSDRNYGQGLFGIISDYYKTHTNVASTGSTIESLYAQYGDGIYINSGSGTFYICDSNYTDVDDFKTAMADAKIAYELSTPVLLATLTAQQVSALVGVNTVWSDADGIELTYLKKG